MPGATLYADATVLHPLVANGVWSYRGTWTRSGGENFPVVYVNAVTQQALPDGSMTETASDSGHSGVAQQRVSVRDGELHLTASFDLGIGPAQTLDQLEFRSPVRVDDQYDILDSHIADSGLDVDGDGLGEALDLAIYARVVGADLVDLVSAPQVSTVRLTTTISARFKLSRTGNLTEAVSATLDTWHAPGVGIVKRRSDVPGADVVGRAPGTTREVATETLVNWDGVTQGIGFLQSRPATTTAGVPIRRVIDAVGFDTHALVMSFVDNSTALGISLNQFDGRGLATASSTHSIDATRSHLVRVGDVARVVTDTGAGILMYSFDAAGNATAAAPVLLKAGAVAPTSTFAGLAAVGGGNALLLVWIEPPAAGGIGYALQAQPFDAAGRTLGAPHSLGYFVFNTEVSNLRAAGAPGHVIVVWDESQPAGFVKRYALIDGPELGTATVHTLAPANAAPFMANPAATHSGSTLLWSWYAGEWHAAGVGFDASGEPLRSNTLDIALETLSPTWLAKTQDMLAIGGTTAIAVGRSVGVKLWPEDFAPGNFTTVTELVPGTEPLATSSLTRLLARGIPDPATAAVQLTGNVLLFSEGNPGPNITSVWRRR